MRSDLMKLCCKEEQPSWAGLRGYKPIMREWAVLSMLERSLGDSVSHAISARVVVIRCNPKRTFRRYMEWITCIEMSWLPNHRVACSCRSAFVQSELTTDESLRYIRLVQSRRWLSVLRLGEHLRLSMSHSWPIMSPASDMQCLFNCTDEWESEGIVVGKFFWMVVYKQIYLFACLACHVVWKWPIGSLVSSCFVHGLLLESWSQLERWDAVVCGARTKCLCWVYTAVSAAVVQAWFKHGVVVSGLKLKSRVEKYFVNRFSDWISERNIAVIGDFGNQKEKSFVNSFFQLKGRERLLHDASLE